MASRLWTMGLVTGLTVMAASVAIPVLRISPLRAAATPGAAQLRAYGGRSLTQRHSASAAKFDGTLADLSRHFAAASTLADLHSMSPAARFKADTDGSALVAVDAITRTDPTELKAALESLGMRHAVSFGNDVGGFLPVAQLEAAAARAEVHALRAALSRTRTGAVTSQGDFAQHSAALRSSDSLTGAGVTVGVLSDSYDCYAVYAASGSGVPASGYAGYAYNGFLATAATDVSTGDLPSGVSVLEEAECLDYGAPIFPPLGDEGRAMLQVVHDVAPGAALAFYTADDSEADFAAGIGKLAAAGATVIADDVGYFDEPFFQDGLVAQAVDAVEAKGVAYFSAAGNDGDAAYDNTSPNFATLASGGSNSGEYLLNFDSTGATTTTALPITLDTLAPGELVAVILEWDQPFVTGAAASGGATSRMDMCVTGATSQYTVLDYDNDEVTCTGANAAGSDPVQILIIANPASATANTPQETLNLVIGLADGTAAPGRVKVVVETDGQTDAPITQFATHSATLQGHPGAAGAAAVGAAFYFNTPACGTSPALLESYSSEGGAPLLFDVDGNRLSTPVVRQKPDFVAPDGGNDTFLGFTLANAAITGSSGQLSTSISECQNDAGYPNFFGTSAATPHAAGIAALMLQANAAVTPAEIYGALRSSALAMDGGSGYNPNSGFGFIQADAAMALIPPAAPTLTLAASSVVVGSSTTITWSSVNTTSCTAAGSWSGTLAASGTQTLTPTTVGTSNYELTCSNVAGTSTATTTSLTVSALTVSATAATSTAAARSGGGGGIGWDWLLLLGAISWVRYRWSPHAPRPMLSRPAEHGRHGRTYGWLNPR